MTEKSYFHGTSCIRESCPGVWGQISTDSVMHKAAETCGYCLKVLHLKDTEMDQLAAFKGHDIQVHRKFYRLPEGTLQLAKISKVLLALEQGRVAEFKGKNLELNGKTQDIAVVIFPYSQLFSTATSKTSSWQQKGSVRQHP